MIPVARRLASLYLYMHPIATAVRQPMMYTVCIGVVVRVIHALWSWARTHPRASLPQRALMHTSSVGSERAGARRATKPYMSRRLGAPISQYIQRASRLALPLPRTCHRRPRLKIATQSTGLLIERCRRCTTAAADLSPSASARRRRWLRRAHGRVWALTRAHTACGASAQLAGGVGARKHGAIDGQRRSPMYGVYLPVSSLNTMNA